MKFLIIFLVSFIFIYLLYLFTVILRKDKYDKYKKGKQIQFFVNKYGLKFKKISFGKFLNVLAIINSLLMAITITIVFVIDNFIIKFLLAFVILIILLLICYSLLGLYIRKKEK